MLQAPSTSCVKSADFSTFESGGPDSDARLRPPFRWPSHREARGYLYVRLDSNRPDSSEATMRALLSVHENVLTMSTLCRGASFGEPGAVAVVLARVPTEKLTVELRPGCTSMFFLNDADEAALGLEDICCLAVDQAQRNKWVAVFRRMEIPVWGRVGLEDRQERASARVLLPSMFPPTPTATVAATSQSQPYHRAAPCGPGASRALIKPLIRHRS
jgi:hypothetical protein